MRNVEEGEVGMAVQKCEIIYRPLLFLMPVSLSCQRVTKLGACDIAWYYIFPSKMVAIFGALQKISQ